MKDFDSLISIWNEQKNSPAIDYKEVLAHHKKSNNKFRLKIWTELVWMALVSLFIIYVWFNMKLSFITTHISLFMLLACCIVYIITQINNLKALKNDDSLLETPEKHIIKIEKFRKDRLIQNTRNYYFYTLAFCIALSFYFIEYFNYVSTLVLILSITITLIWFAICTFIIRKVYIAKEEKRFNEIINNLERLKKQFTDSGE